MNKHRIFSKLLKEPLLHFLMIGFGLFFFFSQLNNDEREIDTQQIIIGKSHLEVISSTFVKENGVSPTNKEMQALLETDIREEVLSREAIGLGLDKNDRVIRHRLAQKMQYLFEDVAMVEEPNDEILKTYFNENIENFIKPSNYIPKYSEAKQQIMAEWLAKQQQKENEIFYEELKSNYEVIIDDEIQKALNMSVPK